METVFINFYDIKKIKTYFMHNGKHVFTIIEHDGIEKSIILNDRELEYFWSLYYKLK